MRGQALVLCLLALGCFARVPARASDPQTYTVAIDETGDKTLDGALSDASQLQALNDKAPVGPFALIARAKNDYDRVQTVLQAFGYYKATVTITVDSASVNDTSLADKLDKVPSGQSVEAKIAIEGPALPLAQYPGAWRWSAARCAGEAWSEAGPAGGGVRRSWRWYAAAHRT